MYTQAGAYNAVPPTQAPNQEEIPPTQDMTIGSDLPTAALKSSSATEDVAMTAAPTQDTVMGTAGEEEEKGERLELDQEPTSQGGETTCNHHTLHYLMWVCGSSTQPTPVL